MFILFPGCFPTETLRVLGVGGSEFKAKGKVFTKVFEEELIDCYNQTVNILKAMGARPYRGSVKKRFIVALGLRSIYKQRCLDTTEIAVFFKSLNRDKETPATQVEVTSLNHSLSEFIAQKLFEKLEEMQELKQLERLE
ncbi:MAG: hypothetical protein ABH858_01270 [Candidatus Omnitrophota bacterium]